jgi:O-antigen/teichoic acid export membrane protein
MVTAFSMVAGIIIARQLGPELRGMWGLVLLAARTVGLLHLGLGPAITYYTGKGEHRREELLTFTIVSSLLLGVVFAIVFFLVYPHVPKVWDDVPTLVILIGIAAVPFTFLINFYRQFLMGMLKVMQSNMLDIIRVTVYLGTVIVLVWVLNGKVLETTICYTVSMVAAGVIGLMLFSRNIKPSATIRPSLIKPLFQYGIKAYVVIIFHFLNYRFDIFLIKYFLTKSDVAFYQIAAGMAERMWYIPNALSFVLLPTLLAMDRSSTKFTTKVCRNGFFVMILLGIAVLLSARPLIVLFYGEDYIRVSHALYSILWGITVTSLYKVIFAHFAAKRRLNITILAASISFVVNIVMNIILIPRIGIVGAGISTSLSQTVLTAILIVFFKKYEKVRLREILFPYREDFASYRETVLKGLRKLRLIRGERRA